MIYAQQENILQPELFIGRGEDFKYFLRWAEWVKKLKTGKTLFLQRFYNILFTANDPKLIPFYFQVKEEKMTQREFSKHFYLSLITQYLA